MKTLIHHARVIADGYREIACGGVLVENGLSERHARALLRLEDPEERLSALRHIIRAGLNVAQTEQYISRRLEALQATPPAGRRTFILKDVRLFLNSLDRGLRLVREAGIGAESRREDTEDAILLTIRIPKAVRRGGTRRTGSKPAFQRLRRRRKRKRPAGAAAPAGFCCKNPGSVTGL